MPGKNDINPSTGQPYAVNPETGVWDDNYWANVVEPQLKAMYGGGDSGGGGNPADELIKSVTEQYEKTAKEYESRLSEFEKKSPFSFDKVLEEETTKVGQRLDPYYKQQLGDFLTGINRRKERSVADRSTLLSDLQADVDTYTGESRVKLDSALRRSQEGFADRGLFSSGGRIREEGELERESQTDMASFMRDKERRERAINLRGTRELEDVGLEKQLTERDIGNFGEGGQFTRGARSEAQVRAESLSESLRRQQLREFEKQQVLGTPPGVDPFKFQYQSFSKLS